MKVNYEKHKAILYEGKVNAHDYCKQQLPHVILENKLRDTRGVFRPLSNI